MCTDDAILLCGPVWIIKYYYSLFSICGDVQRRGCRFVCTIIFKTMCSVSITYFISSLCLFIINFYYNFVLLFHFFFYWNYLTLFFWCIIRCIVIYTLIKFTILHLFSWSVDIKKYAGGKIKLLLVIKYDNKAKC